MRQKQIVGYCRTSTLEQKKGYGIKIQKQAIIRYAKERGWSIKLWYIDEAQSGVKERRRALQKLRRDCKAGKVDIIIVSSLDRLSRSLQLAENLFAEFEDQGIAVHMADMPYYDGNNRKDVLIRQIRAAIAEENRKDIIEKLFNGRASRVENGKISGGNLPYGYMRKNGTTKIQESEAEVVRTIFALHDQGRSDQKISNHLNEHGHCRRNKKSWTKRQVGKIRHRKELYERGIVTYGKSHGKNTDLILLR